MKMQIDQKTLDFVASYELPAYHEIPDVGLYLNQCAKYINGYLEPLLGVAITESMISNYVKKKYISNPQKKQYSREQIAYLIFIAATKGVASLDDLQSLMERQKKDFAIEESYEYFRTQFVSIFHYVFGLKETMEREASECLEKVLLENLIVTLAHKSYLDMAFRLLSSGKEKSREE
ncbi:MAG: DUF1836 domain-containing protein [Spirochaetales bacterium]|nr:DUF1836 domain-containing protein [Candidatus Physcosoma equi]